MEAHRIPTFRAKLTDRRPVMYPTYHTRLVLIALVALVYSTSCSDSTGPTAASVEVSPTNGIVDVGAALQSTAVPKSADGDVLDLQAT